MDYDHFPYSGRGYIQNQDVTHQLPQVMYSFFVTAQLSSKQRLALCGAVDVLGGWDVKKAPPVTERSGSFHGITSGGFLSHRGTPKSSSNF